MNGLKLLHDFGYSHGDLKINNICARPQRDGKFKFTLIDLGVTSKLRNIGELTTHKKFRGNLLTASPDHIINRRPGSIDEVYSLLCVAYLFVYGNLPWREFIQNHIASQRIVDQNQRRVYCKLRKKFMEVFDAQLCNGSG